jgi:hypothetical protein
MRFLFCLVFLVFSSIEVASADEYYYEIFRNHDRIGQCIVKIESAGPGRQLSLQEDISVNLLGVPLFRRQMTQSGTFNSAGQIEKLTSATWENFRTLSLALIREKDHYLLSKNGKTAREIPANAFDLTTLHRYFTKLHSTRWLNAETGSLVDYSVSSDGRKFYLSRPDGTEEVEQDKNGILKTLKMSNEMGTLEYVRTRE